jgi:predicted membrane-bound mannosyltransferase
MCGGIGFVIGLIIFFGWKNSEKDWQRGFAWFCAFWMAVSVLGYCVILTSYS